MKRFAKIVAFFGALAFALAFTGCSENDDDGGSESNSSEITSNNGTTDSNNSTSGGNNNTSDKDDINGVSPSSIVTRWEGMAEESGKHILVFYSDAKFAVEKGGTVWLRGKYTGNTTKDGEIRAEVTYIKDTDYAGKYPVITGTISGKEMKINRISGESDIATASDNRIASEYTRL